MGKGLIKIRLLVNRDNFIHFPARNPVRKCILSSGGGVGKKKRVFFQDLDISVNFRRKNFLLN